MKVLKKIIEPEPARWNFDKVNKYLSINVTDKFTIVAKQIQP